MRERAPADVPIRAGLFIDDDFRPETARLKGSRCATCQQSFFPRREVCPRCRTASTLQEISLSRRGWVSAITAVARPPAHYASPYLLAEVDLPEGVRIVTQIDAPVEKPVQVGAEVSLITRPLLTTPEGARAWGYLFAPAVGPLIEPESA
jgi:uncharacterized OB-fold protein